MWHLRSMLLYREIEHRNEKWGRQAKIGDEFLTPYEAIIRDPRVNPEEANKIAA